MKKDRNGDGIPMKEALASYFKAMGMEDKLVETKVLSQWTDIMGDTVGMRTTNKYIKNEILYLKINSSVMRDQLQQEKEQIIKKVNAVAGFELIKDIFLK